MNAETFREDAADAERARTFEASRCAAPTPLGEFAGAVADVRAVIAKIEKGELPTTTAAVTLGPKLEPSLAREPRVEPAPAPKLEPTIRALDRAQTALRATAPAVADVFDMLQKVPMGRAAALPSVIPAVTAVPLTPELLTVVPSTPAPDLTSVREPLIAIVRKLGSHPALPDWAKDVVPEAQYALTALIDEWLIHDTRWSFREEWCRAPLESAMYGTRSAGRMFFAKIVGLVRGDRGDPIRRELAALYLLTLKLGFRGEWHEDNKVQLGRFQEALSGQLPAPDPNEQHAFPQAYRYGPDKTPGKRLVPLGRWWRYCAVGLAAYLVASSVVWFWLSSPLLRLL